jgi:type II secretory pathway pseudopilin PulG
MRFEPVHACHAIGHRQRGVALIIVVVLLVIGVGAALFAFIRPASQAIERDKVTAAALAQAKDALIGYAASYDTLPGALPCPDLNNNGQLDFGVELSGSNCVSYIGRLPWKTLGLPDLRDGSGECLWYALSPDFRMQLAASARSPANYPLNSSTAGQLTVYDATGAALPAPSNPVIAIVFAPGPALSGQDRTPLGSTVCGGNTTAAAYLDSAAGINNATGNSTGSFIAANVIDAAGNPSVTFNDRLLYITAAQFFPAVQRRVAAEIRGLGTPSTPSSGLRSFYNNPALQYYPWAANAGSAGTQVLSNSLGLIPYNDPSLQFSPATLTWLINNDWVNIAVYEVAANFQQGTPFPQQCGGGGVGCLTVNGYNLSQAKVTVGSVSSIVCTTNALVTVCP